MESPIRPVVIGMLALLACSLLLGAGAQASSGVVASMTVDRMEASPGDSLSYAISIQPLKNSARNLVVTDPLPEGLAFVSAEAPPSCVGGHGRWECNQLDLSAFSIEVRASVKPGTEGLELVNVARIEYAGGDDGEEAQFVTVQAAVRVVASSPSPVPHLVVQLNVSQEAVVPGAELNYQIRLTNDGGGFAENVSVVVSMPSPMVLLSASPWPLTRDGELEWSWETFPAEFVDLFFNMTLPHSSGLTEIQVEVTVTYGDGQQGDVHVQSARSKLGVLPSNAGPPSTPFVPLLVGAILVGGLGVLVAFRIIPLPFSLGEGADEIFLLHRSGLLLKHFSVYSSREADSDIVGGMMAAVRMFVEDSVAPDAGPLREIRFGRGTIRFVTGENVTLAAVNPKGNAERFVGRATRFLREFEAMNAKALANFDGNAGGLQGIEAAFEKAGAGPAQAENPVRIEPEVVPRQ